MAVRIGVREHLVESKALQQADRAQIPRIDGCKKRSNPEITGKTWNRGPAGFERDAAPPVFGRKDESLS